MKNYRLGAYIFLFFLALYLLTFRGYGGEGDEAHAYFTARSLLNEGKLYISPEVNVGTVGVGGKRYAITGLFWTIVILPMVALGNLISHITPSLDSELVSRFVISTTQPIISSLACILLFNFLKRLGYSVKISVVSTLLYGLTTMAWHYAKGGFSEPLNSLLIFCSIYYLCLFTKTYATRYLCCAGMFFGFAFATKFYNLIFLIPLYYYLLSELTQKRFGLLNIFKCINIFSAPIFLSLITVGLYNFYRYGNMLATGYITPQFSPIYIGLYGFLFSPGKSFFLFNPPLILSLLGIKNFYKKFPSLCRTIILIAVLHIVFFSMFSSWHTFRDWGPRYLFPLVILFMPFAGEFFSGVLSKNKRRFIVLICLILVAGLLIQLPAVIMNQERWPLGLSRNLDFSMNDLIFVPNLSPVVGGYTLFIIAIKNWTHNLPLTLNFIKSYGILHRRTKTTVEFLPYDVTPDIWFYKILYFHKYSYIIRADGSKAIIKVSSSLLKTAALTEIFLFIFAILFGFLLFKRGLSNKISLNL